MLKLYLSSLPEPLLTYNLFKSFLAVPNIPTINRQLHTLRTLLCQVIFLNICFLFTFDFMLMFYICSGISCGFNFQGKEPLL